MACCPFQTVIGLENFSAGLTGAMHFPVRGVKRKKLS